MAADPSEQFVLRRVHRNEIRPGQPTPIGPGAFRPTPSDTEGLSVSFESAIDAASLAAAGRQPAAEYGVVRLRVSELLALDVSVVADDSPTAPPGHAFIPEINVSDYHDPSRKPLVKELIHKLAKLAAHDIVLLPKQAP